jgi:hypothetical protein
VRRLQDAALGKLFRPAVAQNASMSTPVVGQLYFLEKRDTRLASFTWVSVLTVAGPSDGAARVVSRPLAAPRLAAVELLHSFSRSQNGE